MAHDNDNCVCEETAEEPTPCELCECATELESMICADVWYCKRCWNDACDAATELPADCKQR